MGTDIHQICSDVKDLVEYAGAGAGPRQLNPLGER